MSWLSGWLSRTPLGPARPWGHRSLALRALLDSLRPGPRHAVLDLGAPVGGNVEFLSALHCRVRIADLHHSLAAEPLERREPKPFRAWLSRQLPLAPEEVFDALFFWDVLNYMRPDQVSSLIARIAPACRPGALVLAFAWTRRQMPLLPLRYRIADRENVVWDGWREGVRPAPRYGEHDFVRMMPGFTVKSSFLLRSGIQEYLFSSPG